MKAISRLLTAVVAGSVLIAASGCYWLWGVAKAPPTRPFVTGTDLGTLRDDYDGWIGMKITVGATPITVTALGRYVAPGNRRTHTLKIVAADSGKDVASTEVSLEGARAHQFQYAPLPDPVVLEAGQSYHVVTSETFASDQWHHSNTQVGTSEVGTCDSAVYWSNMNLEWTTEASKNHTFGPVDFLYRYE